MNMSFFWTVARNLLLTNHSWVESTDYKMKKSQIYERKLLRILVNIIWIRYTSWVTSLRNIWIVIFRHLLKVHHTELVLEDPLTREDEGLRTHAKDFWMNDTDLSNRSARETSIALFQETANGALSDLKVFIFTETAIRLFDWYRLDDVERRLVIAFARFLISCKYSVMMINKDNVYSLYELNNSIWREWNGVHRQTVRDEDRMSSCKLIIMSADQSSPLNDAPVNARDGILEVQTVALSSSEVDSRLWGRLMTASLLCPSGSSRIRVWIVRKMVDNKSLVPDSLVCPVTVILPWISWIMFFSNRHNSLNVRWKYCLFFFYVITPRLLSILC